MLRQGHELDMRIIHVFDVFDQLIGEIPVREIILRLGIATPRTGMHFVNEHRLLVRGLPLLLFHIRAVFPLVALEFVETGSGERFTLRVETVRIGFENVRSAPLRLDRVFVNVADFEPFNKDLPSLAVLTADHLVPTRIPLIEIADDTD